ncbi:MAG: hypothetical protein H6737_18420 [Alphaproteobacteria bacterium]|nr:hypothetical protein [Alphaproteobacteria bacterium]
MAVFELDWLGGAAERAFAPHRGDVDGLPWGTLDWRRFTPAELDQARMAWTTSAHQEWCAAAGFAALLTALLRAGAPVDLVGMAGRFVADEMVHTELNARMAAEVGGGVALQHDPTQLCPPIDPALSPLEAALELAVRVSCVGETFSLPVLAGTRNVATEPIVKAVMARIVADEGPHGRLGWLVLDWALPRLDARQRAWIGAVAADAVAALEPLWTEPAAPMPDATRHALGWMTPTEYRAVALDAVERRIRRPLEARGLCRSA